MKQFFLGEDRVRFGKFLLGVIICTALTPVVYEVYAGRTVWGTVSLPTVLFVVMFVPAIVHAYLNEGLLPTLSLGVIAGFQYNLYKFLFDVEAPYRSDPTTVTDVVTQLQLPSVGVASAVVGFLVGISLRYGVAVIQK